VYAQRHRHRTTGASFFWPVFRVGWGIGVATNAWAVYRPDEPSKDRIRRQMERLRGQP